MKSAQSLRAVVLLGLLACSRAESQSGLTLEQKLPGSFAQLSNVVEMESGRVAFADTRDKLFLSADLASGDVDTLGTRVETITGESPAGQYKFPGWVARLGGDTVALVDFAAQRTTLWGGSGFNDLGPAYSLLNVQNGKAALTNVQLIMACTDAEDGTESSRAFDARHPPAWPWTRTASRSTS